MRAPSASSRHPREAVGPRLRRCAMAEALDEPVGVVLHDELADDPSRLLKALELVQVDALLLERAHEALGDPVALRFADVRRRDRAPEPLHLVDPGVGDVLRAPVAADRQARATSLPKRPKAWRTPWRVGSSAAQRSPSFAVCQPTTSSRW